MCLCVKCVLPSSLTTSGTFSSSSRQALVMPLAMMAQLTMPPKMLTKIASTCENKQKNHIFINKVVETSKTKLLHICIFYNL